MKDVIKNLQLKTEIHHKIEHKLKIKTPPHSRVEINYYLNYCQHKQRREGDGGGEGLGEAPSLSNN